MRAPLASSFGLAVVVSGILALGVGRESSAQVEIDRVLVHVNGHVVTSSDVRQAKLLQLVEGGDTDEAVQRALEDRILMLDEVTRSASTTPHEVPGEAELAAHRREWEGRLGGSARSAALLKQAGMSEASLQAWLRDDLRIRDYLSAQFGSLSAPDRAKATADWLARLRQRAGLK